jgi:ribosome biogenesis GTPase
MNLKTLGWDSQFDEAFQKHKSAGLEPTRIVSREGSLYEAIGEAGEFRGKMSGRMRYELAASGDSPAVGDWVAVEASVKTGSMTIHAILPRRSKFMRATYDNGNYTRDQVICANVDFLIIVVGLDEEFNLNRLERYLAQTSSSGSRPIIVLNKTDLCRNLDEITRQVKTVAKETPVIPMSAKSGKGLSKLREFLGEGKTGSLVGPSGVGKSTIINALLGENRFDTNEVRDYDSKGRHTTKHRELVLIQGGGMLIDNPGMRGIGVTGEQDLVGSTFEDVKALARQCKFSDCQHRTEPGCAVKAAIENGTLSEAHFENYKRLQRELWAINLKKSERAKMGKKLAVWSRKYQKLKRGDSERPLRDTHDDSAKD